MFDSTAPNPQPDAAPPPQTRAERRMRRLELMADQGVELGRLLVDQGKVAAACANSDAMPDKAPHAQLLNDIANAHARVTRAVAIASAIEDRIDKGLPALPDIDHARRLREDAAREKRARAADAVDRAIDQCDLNPRRKVHIRIGLHRLLDAEMADLDRFLSRPLPDLAARLRRDLGMDPTPEDEAWLDDENPSPGRGGMGPVRSSEREGGVTDAGREPAAPTAPQIPSAYEFARAARAKPEPPVAPSPLTNPSPSRGEGQGWGCVPDVSGPERERGRPSPSFDEQPRRHTPIPTLPPSRGKGFATGRGRITKPAVPP